MCLRKLDFEIEMAQKVRLKKSLLKQPQRFPSNDAYATQRSDVAMATVVNCEGLTPLKGPDVYSRDEPTGEHVSQFGVYCIYLGIGTRLR